MAREAGKLLNEYRPDIDGLRALAVSAVVFFHAEIAGFRGGYVGVDVFFVISGYLITRILYGEAASTGIDIVRFYERRIRRILPALFVLFLITLAGGYALLMPTDLVELAKEVLASLLFVSNVKFWRGADYWFSGVRPLLHTWSLSIEEQFYLFFPLSIMFLSKFGLTTTRRTLLFIWLLSLAISALGANFAPSANFFLLPSRIWELATGAMLALDLLPRLRRPHACNFAAAIGLAMVVVPCFTYSEMTPFPGLPALLPCIGAAILLQAGRDAGNVVSQFLSQPVFVGIGLISYSLYLYHFPIILFAKELAGTERLPVLWAWGAIIISLALAALSWRFVERPFRNERSVGRSAILCTAVACSALVATASAAIVVASGFPGRFTIKQRSILAASVDIEPRFQECIKLPLPNIFFDRRCQLGDASNVEGGFVLLGDSHAAAIASAIAPLAAERAIRGTLVGFGSCPPLLGLPMTHLKKPAAAECVDRVDNAVEMIQRDRTVSTVIIVAYWSAYDRYYGPKAAFLISSGLLRTVAALRGKSVVVLYDLPSAPNSLPRNLVIADRFGLKLPVLSLGENDGVLEASHGLKKLGARLISLAPPLCHSRLDCPPFNAGRPVLIDTNHLSRSVASRAMARYLSKERIFDQPSELRGEVIAKKLSGSVAGVKPGSDSKVK